MIYYLLLVFAKSSLNSEPGVSHWFCTHNYTVLWQWHKHGRAAAWCEAISRRLGRVHSVTKYYYYGPCLKHSHLSEPVDCNCTWRGFEVTGKCIYSCEHAKGDQEITFCIALRMFDHACLEVSILWVRYTVSELVSLIKMKAKINFKGIELQIF